MIQTLNTPLCFINKMYRKALIVLTIILLPEAQAFMGCQLNKGYELPENVSLTWFCTFTHELATAVHEPTNKYGAVNRQGIAVIPFEYDSPVSFSHGRSLVQKGDKWIIIDTYNNEMATFNFQYAQNFSSVGLGLFKENGKWGVINTKGEKVVEPKFDSFIYGFGYPSLNEEVVAVFELDGKQGVINRTGNIIVEPKFDEIQLHENVMLVLKNEKIGIYDYDGQMIQPVEFEPGIGFYSDSIWPDEDGMIVVRDDKMGVVNRKGTIVVPVEFDKVDVISHDRFKVSKNNKYGIYARGNLEVPMMFDHIARTSNYMTRVKYQDKWGYLDNFNSLITVDYDEANDFHEGLAAVANSTSSQSSNDNLLWGYINTLGEEVIPLDYEEVRPFNEGLAPVKLKCKWGVIDFKNYIIVPFKYDGIGQFENGYAIVSERHVEKAMCPTETNPSFSIAEDAEEEIMPEVDSLIDTQIDCERPLYINSLDNREQSNMKYGLINTQGKVVLPIRFDNITQVAEGMIGIKNKNKWGFMSQNDDLVMPYQFDEIYPPYENGTIETNMCTDDENNTISCRADEMNSQTRHIDKFGNVIREIWGSSGVADEVEE